MEQKIKRTRNRVRKYTMEELNDHSLEYWRNKSWYCEICNPKHNYRMWGKTNHLKTLKHRSNILKKVTTEIERV